MKKIITLIAALAVLIGVVLCFAACGKAKDDIKNDMTSMMDDATTLMDEVSTGLDNLADDLTENGNVTDESEEGMTNQDATNESATGGEGGMGGEGMMGGEENAQTTAAE